MTEQNHNDLRRDFPKTAMEFEARFPTEEACRAWWIEARWARRPARDARARACGRSVRASCSSARFPSVQPELKA